jgi:ERCC4-type nuclease
MILLDDRVGSRHLLKPLREMGLPVKLVRLNAGDAAFFGHGPNGRIRVCIEVKRLDDMLGSFLTKRLAKQLRKMHQSSTTPPSLWLILQGEYREGRDGLIEKARGRDKWKTWQRASTSFPWESLTGTLLTLMTRAKMEVLHTRSDKETARMIGLLYRWWGKPWDRHHSHMGVVEDFPAMWGADPFLRRRPTPLEEFASLLPKIGLKRSEFVARKFGTVDRAVRAPMSEWVTIPGVGTKVAKGIFDWLRKGKGK